MIYESKIEITRIKVLVIGDKGVGKTSLIRSFKEEKFQPEWEGIEEIERKIVTVGENKISFQMVEMHPDEEVPACAAAPDAVLLLYDDESDQALSTLRTKLCSKVNLHFASVPLFLVRAKCDNHTTNTTAIGQHMADSIHALRFFECSAKLMNGIKYVFLEVYSSIKKRKNGPTVATKDPTEAGSRVGCLFGMVSNSGPLFRQVYTNVRECIKNPASFPTEKRTLEYYIPFCDFGLESPKDDVTQRNDDDDSDGGPEKKKGRKGEDNSDA